MSFSKQEPLFGINIAAQKIKVSLDRLRVYEREGLVSPARTNPSSHGKRLYSQYEIEWLILIRTLLVQYNMNIETLKVFLKLIYVFKQKNVAIDEQDQHLLRLFNGFLKNPLLEIIAPSLL